MNDEGRDVLAAAWLRGHKQIKRAWHGNDGGGEGECAMGVLHLDVHKGNRQEAMRCGTAQLTREVLLKFDMSAEEESSVIKANDVRGWDFLTISRKIGIEPHDTILQPKGGKQS